MAVTEQTPRGAIAKLYGGVNGVLMVLHTQGDSHTPPDRFFRAARKQGRALSVARGRPDMVDDFMSEAVCGLLREWPKLFARYDPVTLPLVRHVVNMRLADWCRIEFGRHGRWKPHVNRVLLTREVWRGGQKSAEYDDDTGTGATHFTPKYIIDLIMSAQNRGPGVHARTLRRRRSCLEWEAQGKSRAWMGRALGISESAVCLLMKSTFVAARKNSAEVRALQDQGE